MTASRQRIRVLVVDDHAVVRGGLRTFLDAFDDFKLVGEAENGEEAIRACLDTRADVVLMDLLMPQLDGVAATKIIRERYPDVRVIALTSFQDEEKVQAALDAGAIGYILKNVSADELANAIRAAWAGRPTLAPEAAQVLIRAAKRTPAPGDDLTPREREVFEHLVRGLPHKQIAYALSISERTVKLHRHQIVHKLQARSLADLAVIAERLGLLPNG